MDRFSIKQGTFQYMPREKFEALAKEIGNLSRTAYRKLFVYGTIGYGKSHILAAMTCFLIRQGKRVVYLPDCRAMIKNTSHACIKLGTSDLFIVQHDAHAAMIDKATTDSTPFHRLRGFGLEDLCCRILNERLSLRPQNFVSEFFGLHSKARWFLEVIEYENNTDADFLIVERTKSSEMMLCAQRTVIIGNTKHNPFSLKEEANVEKCTRLVDSFRTSGFKPKLALFAGEDVTREDETAILSRWTSVDFLPNVFTLPKLLKYLVSKPNGEPCDLETFQWDRVPEKERISNNIEEGGTVIVTGPWRAGKTTLLYKLAQEKNWPYYTY